MPSEDEYVLGTDAEELTRLGFQHRLWSDAALSVWKRSGIRMGSVVLDVGCGPGFGTFDISQLVGPKGLVVGVDISDRFITEATRSAGALGIEHARFVVGDAGDLEPLVGGHGPFDAAYSRWMLCFVPEPRRVVQGISGLIRPGGKVAIHDYFNWKATSIASRDERFQGFVDAWLGHWQGDGGDPDVVGKLPGMFEDAGLDVDVVEVHQRVARPGDFMWGWFETFCRSITPRMREAGSISAEEARVYVDMLEDLRADPNNFIVFPALYEIIATKRA